MGANEANKPEATLQNKNKQEADIIPLKIIQK